MVTTRCRVVTVVVFPFLVLSVAVSSLSLSSFRLYNNNNNNNAPTTTTTIPREYEYNYDCIVIGGGASGLFAAGTTSSLGSKTLLLDLVSPAALTTAATTSNPMKNNMNMHTNDNDNRNYLGGDCTNYACVPTKAVRSIARMATTSMALDNDNDDDDAATPQRFQTAAVTSDFGAAYYHAQQTRTHVRNRERPKAMVERNPKLDVVFVEMCAFVSPQAIQVAVVNPTVDFYTSTNRTLLPQERHPRIIHNTGAVIDNAASMNKNNTTSSSSSGGGTTTTIILSSKKFIIATGAAPFVPPALAQQARVAKIPLFTYRTVLQLYELLDQTTNTSTSTTPRHVVIVGGGATALELAQSIARLGGRRRSSNKDGKNSKDSTTNTKNLTQIPNTAATVTISLIAPELLKSDHNCDRSLQEAAKLILESESNIRLYRHRYLTQILPNKSIELDEVAIVRDSSKTRTHRVSAATSAMNTTILLPGPAPDAILFCVGRYPNIETLDLEKANIAYDPLIDGGGGGGGILVKNKNLQSKTNKRVYACGDCCSVVSSGVSKKYRNAIHAGYTGYQAAINTIVPYFPFRLGSKAHNPNTVVPRVIYTDPELVAVGMSQQDCDDKYGRRHYNSIYVSENGTDRADMDCHERRTGIGYVELRCTKIYGTILGFSSCGPSGSELANEMSVILSNKLSVHDIATKSLHSYPSHGYLLYRACLALSFGTVWGQLIALGPIGKHLARVGQCIATIISPMQKFARLLLKKNEHIINAIKRKSRSIRH